MEVLNDELYQRARPATSNSRGYAGGRTGEPRAHVDLGQAGRATDMIRRLRSGQPHVDTPSKAVLELSSLPSRSGGPLRRQCEDTGDRHGDQLA